MGLFPASATCGQPDGHTILPGTGWSMTETRVTRRVWGGGAGRRGFSTRPACDRMKKIHVYTPLPTFIGCPLCPRPCREKALMTLLPPTGVPSSERRWCSSTGAAQLSKRLEARLPLPGPRAWPPQSSDRCLAWSIRTRQRPLPPGVGEFQKDSTVLHTGFGAV